MAKKTRQRGAYGRLECVMCRQRQATVLCDGVLRDRARWTVCNRPLCSQCAIHRARNCDYCRPCAVVRGYVTREVGEEG